MVAALIKMWVHVVLLVMKCVGDYCCNCSYFSVVVVCVKTQELFFFFAFQDNWGKHFITSDISLRPSWIV